MKIFLVQAKPKIGDLSYNFDLIERYYKKAQDLKTDICLFPELITTGYIPEDLLLSQGFIKKIQNHITTLCKQIQDVAALIPTPLIIDNSLYNGVIAIQNRSIIGQSTKEKLPNYSIFDEKRYFVEGIAQIIEINGIKIGIPICEDIWSPDILLRLKKLGAQIFLVPNASPYHQKKFEIRVQLVKQRFEETSIPIIYCNQVLGHNGIVYDGSSFTYEGKLKHCLNSFTEDSAIIEIKDNQIIHNHHISPNYFTLEDELYGAMVLSLRDYLANNYCTSVIIGLSGGIDSALVAAIAVDSIGKDNVHAIMMPHTDISSDESMRDALEIARLLDIQYHIIPINDMVKTIKNSLHVVSDLAYENLQSRARGIILMTMANSYANTFVLNTGNKSENATGYTTLYGDMCGAFNPIKDLYKTQVYKVAKFRNKKVPQSINVHNNSYPIMPQGVITKAPSAELRINQKDIDTLPDYEILDRILYSHIEQKMTAEEIINLGFDNSLVNYIVNLVKKSEFKRYQSSPGTKLSICSFDKKDRRYPI